MKKIKDLTAVVLTKNEEKNLPRCLTSLGFVGKIVVLDDGSTDRTVEIAKKAGAKVFERALDDFCTQRNFALSKVETEWVLMIDADEEVPLKLAKEIGKVLKEDKFDGFQFPRKNLIFGRWIKHSGWYPDFQLHLFRTKKGKYVEKVHEQVRVNGTVGFLKNDLVHYNYDTVSHFISPVKFDQYTSLEADQLVAGGYKFKWIDLVYKPVDEFLRRFFAEKGYKDGVAGLILGLFQGFSEFVVHAKVWENAGKEEKEINPDELVEKLKGALFKKKKEIGFWFLSAQIKMEKNFFKRLWLRLKRKTLRR